VLEKIGKYEIRMQVGRGAMGIVYEGYDPVIGRRVAIKTLRTEMFEARQLPEVLARFKREAQSAGRLSHPHVVTIHDYGEHEGSAYIVMEYIKGSELGHELNRGVRYPLEDTVRIMMQLLGALAHAHENKVVHRDLKPANMFLLEDGSLKVVDFGIAHVEASDLTDTGAMLGTPAYMSPEQCLGIQVDHRSDLFSAGVILYQLLTGDRPFTGSVTTIIQKVLRQEPLAPSELNPTLSPAWDKVVARAMAKKPEARYESARRFAEAVKTALVADRVHEDEVRRKAAEAEEHAQRAAEERSRDESLRRAEDERREAERRAMAEMEARKAAEARARHEAEERTVAMAKPGASRASAIAVAILVAAAVLGAVLYSRRGAEDQASKAEAVRIAAESRAEAEAKKAAEEKVKVPALKKEEEKRKAELAAKKEAGANVQAEPAKKARGARRAVQRAGTEFQDCPDCPRMVVIPAGNFTMGSPASEAWRDNEEGPQHRVVNQRPFAAGRYEVTFDEWDACFRENGCRHNPEDAGWGRGRRPVINVSWRDAKQYAEWLSRKTGKRYRLLTEAEWEYAARAGTATKYSAGETISLSQANFGARQTVPVGSFGPNAFGLFDVHGNVWEWTEDCWNASYNGAPADGSAWLSSDCSLRVIRGGSWDNNPRGVRSASRYRVTTGDRNNINGFRVARTLERAE
jgi:formylglycine-generating enzyme required for sulfatase activity/tRNA A-37 threonylcarbamoyl transferase component Bud32